MSDFFHILSDSLLSDCPSIRFHVIRAADIADRNES
jgi:hypothetical protein